MDDCSVLSAFPESGRKVFRTDGAEADFRILQSRGKMIVYDVADDVVRVVTLIDSRTDELSELVR